MASESSSQRLAGTTNSLIESAESFGRVGMLFSIVVAGIIGTGFMYGGYHFTTTPTPERVQVDATVLEVVKCETNQENTRTCEATLMYDGLALLPGETGYTYFFQREVAPGQTIKMEHPVGEPRILGECCSWSNEKIGALFFTLAALLYAGTAWLWWARSNKAAATLYGGGMAAGMGRRAFNMF